MPMLFSNYQTQTNSIHKLFKMNNPTFLIISRSFLRANCPVDGFLFLNKKRNMFFIQKVDTSKFVSLAQ